MGLTLAEKIFLRHSSKKRLEDFVYSNIDFCFANDITGPLAVKQFYKITEKRVFNSKRIAFVCDHFTPAKDKNSANNVAFLRNFSLRFKIPNFFDINQCGIEHVFLAEKGFIKPLDLVVGADSHTCTFGALGALAIGVGSTDLAGVMATGTCWFKVPKSLKFIYKGRLSKWVSAKDLILYTIFKIGVDGALYKVMEFSGPVIKSLNMEGRFTICNMAIEAGAKTGIIEPDGKTFNYLRRVAGLKLQGLNRRLKSDPDASYEEIYEWDVSNLEPQVACPHLPSNVKPVSKLSSVKLDQVVIGSCTNGRISDLRVAAKILKGRKVKSNSRVIIIPATPNIYKQALKEGLIRIFIEAGCIISPPTCGPCLGGHMGILGKGEVSLATTNRNFIGRMGHPESFVYLASPAVASASAIKGRITHPQEVVG
ncbi:MAG TPA: 3-isopropylmalate dehydratase large subunit [Candidatus Omnitrophica bacterium]|nr:MAG: 3-isopropylmalate dehydratase large subunit [Candidatus Omnitrophota bacterium]RKY34185.1 MAG: 3-isopropylmalate dehydratase large subunit [Candidatus Omnitrophota bacterium]RKY43845.1 MAG: 3-isopropylmalate dehydratase large subunit [Candidatus Omnitrophota bacterium]HEC70086.1 3-isopropylmalate dehydratase large subunit [Candidatus Omnitrophota bacterium]